MDCGQNSTQNSVFPLGLVFPGDKGIQRGLTSTYYKAICTAHRSGVGAVEYRGHPREAIWRAREIEHPRGIRTCFTIRWSNWCSSSSARSRLSAGVRSRTIPNFNLPFLPQSSDPTLGPFTPNPFSGNYQADADYALSRPRVVLAGCVDWASFRPMLLFGEFAPNLRTQYAAQYNLTIERQVTKDMVFRIAYIGTQAHRLLASHDLNYGNPETVLATE